MHGSSPPEKRACARSDRSAQARYHVLDGWSGDELLGCGALKELDPGHGEVKSMRTSAARRRLGVGRALLQHVLAEAGSRSYARLSLETGSAEGSHRREGCTQKFGFGYCAPFADYRDDPNSVFMTRVLGHP